jgi:uncharacterized protein (TIGR01777 family)
VKVFVTGATGLIGRELCAALAARGDGVLALSRRADPEGLPEGVRTVQGDPSVAGPWLEALAEADAVVHLAGEPVAEGRWTRERKRRIRDSRLRSTALVAGLLAARGPRVLVSGSAVGYYGSRGDELLDEDAAPGTGFLADVSRAWEDAAWAARRRARVVVVRTGIVLANEGGALPQLVRPFRIFAGGPLGRGDFWQPWIHLADQVGLVLLALDDARAEGPLNAAAPAPARNKDVARAIGAALGRPSFLPAPEAAVRLALGELASVVLSSQRVVPRKALELGYTFRFESVEAAVRDLLRAT